MVRFKEENKTLIISKTKIILHKELKLFYNDG